MDLKQYLKVGLLGATLGFIGIPLTINALNDVQNKKERLIQIAQKEENKKCFIEFPEKYSKKDLEKIILNENTPASTYNRISSDIHFIYHRFNDKDGEKIKKNYPGKGACFRYYSLQETYNFGSGLCIDGALSFCGLLSDNPEYDCKVVVLRMNDGRAHAISTFKQNGKIGYASFNDPGQGTDSVFISAQYNSFEDLIKNKFSQYNRFARLKIDNETLKFGKGIRGNKLEDNSDWIEIKSLLNERTARFKLKVKK